MSFEAQPRMVGPYHVGPTIGKGGFSKVKIGVHEETGEKVALKIMKRDEFEKLSDQTRKQVESELNAMNKIHHKNVVQLRGVEWECSYPKSNGKFYPAIVVVLELATGGEFFDFLAFTGCFEEAIARTYFHQLMEGVGYCHSQGVVHRDLKPENLLLSHDFVLKLADFGFANTIPEDVLMYTQCGTPAYMAPEVIRNQGYDATKTDIWACGVILFIMLAGFPPLQKCDMSDWWFSKLATNKHALFWAAHSRNAYFSEPLKDLINKILQPDPESRITVEEIMQHDWFQGATISEDALVEELTRRKEQVDASKQAEQNEAKRQKAAAMAQQNNSGGFMDESLDRDVPPCMPSLTMTYQPLAKDLTSNFSDLSFEEEYAPLEEEAKAAPKQLDADFACYTSFESRKEPAQIMSRLTGVFDDMQGDYSVKRDSFKIKASIRSDSAYIQLSAQVFQDPSNEGAYVVQFRKVQGDSTAFRSLYTTIWSQCGNIVHQE